MKVVPERGVARLFQLVPLACSLAGCQVSSGISTSVHGYVASDRTDEIYVSIYDCNARVDADVDGTLVLTEGSDYPPTFRLREYDEMWIGIASSRSPGDKRLAGIRLALSEGTVSQEIQLSDGATFRNVHSLDDISEVAIRRFFGGRVPGGSLEIAGIYVFFLDSRHGPLALPAVSRICGPSPSGVDPPDDYGQGRLLMAGYEEHLAHGRRGSYLYAPASSHPVRYMGPDLVERRCQDRPGFIRFLTYEKCDGPLQVRSGRWSDIFSIDLPDGQQLYFMTPVNLFLFPESVIRTIRFRGPLTRGCSFDTARRYTDYSGQSASDVVECPAARR